MLADVIEAAADLAEFGEPTVCQALIRYREHRAATPTSEGQLWVSVAFLLDRHRRLRASLPAGVRQSREAI